MSQDETKTVTMLQELIETSEDGKKGFQEAAQRADDVKLKQLFQDRAESCAEAANELQNMVMSMGGKTNSSGSALGAAHRGWVWARSAVGDSNVAVLEEVERGEDYAKGVYGRALKASLPEKVKTVVERQYQGVLSNHDRIRQLRNQYRAQG
ncbi:conserved hypothetical protein [Solimonas aquatica]|uniref:DUF2383 domain-containing protein n=1 Tax=Solimonas aquatica TaxID=489703 RepID=A0A1H9AEQ9_9GAMM|nr:PA2169 family four-helix-bundle protein [Solimonas aquatica]SEP75224.1 conserved hypothetical protein [Solimonas aquatica]